MKYSIIFCYREREKHLATVIPRVRELFAGKDFEIIVVEQNDHKKFRRANLLNEGAKLATGDVLIFHDIDYYPTDAVEYFNDTSDVYLPVKQVIFVDEKMNPLNTMDVPVYYRHFAQRVDDDFYGGVISIRRDAFFKMGGFSPLFIGWGFEDVDLRHRIEHYELSVVRASANTFNALPHSDSGPSQGDPDFKQNIYIAHNWQFYSAHGVNTQPSTTEIIHHPMWPDVDMWVKATDFDLAPAYTVTPI